MSPREFFATIESIDTEALRRILESDPEMATLERRHPEHGYRQTALQLAAGLGFREGVRLLLEAGANPWDAQQGGYPAVVYADDRGHAEVRQDLVEATIRVDCGFPPTFGIGIDLINASRNGWLDAVREHVAKDPYAIYRRGCIGEGVLHWPAHNDHVEILTALLDAGAPIDMHAIGLYGGTPLHWAAEHAPGSLRVLLDRGADPMSRNLADDGFQGYTPLHMAADQKEECIANAEMLLAAGADPSARDAKGQTPLEVAEAKGRARMAAFLRTVPGAQG